MKKIKSIVPGSLAKVLGLVYGLLGLIVGFVFLVISLVAIALGHAAGWFSLIGVVFFPLMYGILGLVLGYITAALYNFVASKVGGIAFEVE